MTTTESLPRKQFVRQCIFCGADGVTKEHVYPRWMRNYLPNDLRTDHQVSLKTQELHTGTNQHTHYEQPGAMNKTGALRSRKLEVVCQSCNGGWMSMLQSEAKRPLEQMIHGRFGYRTLKAQASIASWACMFTTIHERGHVPTATVNFHQRQKFMAAKLPPPGWLVWIGRSSDSLASAHFGFHRGFGISKVLSPDIPMDTQLTFAQMGRLCLLTFSTIKEPHGMLRDQLLQVTAGHAGFRPVWPPSERPIFEDPVPFPEISAEIAGTLIADLSKVIMQFIDL